MINKLICILGSLIIFWGLRLVIVSPNPTVENCYTFWPILDPILITLWLLVNLILFKLEIDF